MENSIQVKIPSLGTVSGKSCGVGLECFLGIPYASLTKRWTRPELVAPFFKGHHDGTRYGPTCPQPSLPQSITQVAVPTHEPNPEVGADEFRCLNLNIVRPSRIEGKLPVMVWIHGGAFSVGSNSEKVYDGIDLVEQSVKVGMPIIHVAINYRLGFFGFLASHELLQQTGQTSVGNYGLWDQRAALEFIHRTIEGFGGDSERVTIFGESAGAASVHSHLVAGKPLFERAICQSGVTHTLGPLPLDSAFHQGLYEELQTHLKVQGVDALQSLPAGDIVRAMESLYPDLPVFFLVDDSELSNGFFPLGTVWISTPKFCKALMLGYCTNEGIIMARSLAAITPQTLQRCPMPAAIMPERLSSICREDIETTDTRELIRSLIDFQTDLAFKAPMESVKANAPADSLFCYRFERENSWSSSAFGGMAHHTIDLLYLAGIPFRHHTKEQAIDIGLSEQMILAWIEFGNGLQPWLPYGKQHTELVIGRDGSFKESDQLEVVSPAIVKIQEEMVENWKGVVHLNATLSNGAVRS